MTNDIEELRELVFDLMNMIALETDLPKHPDKAVRWFRMINRAVKAGWGYPGR